MVLSSKIQTNNTTNLTAQANSPANEIKPTGGFFSKLFGKKSKSEEPKRQAGVDLAANEAPVDLKSIAKTVKTLQMAIVNSLEEEGVNLSSVKNSPEFDSTKLKILSKPEITTAMQDLTEQIKNLIQSGADKPEFKAIMQAADKIKPSQAVAGAPKNTARLLKSSMKNKAVAAEVLGPIQRIIEVATEEASQAMAPSIANNPGQTSMHPIVGTSSAQLPVGQQLAQPALAAA